MKVKKKLNVITNQVKRYILADKNVFIDLIFKSVTAIFKAFAFFYSTLDENVVLC